MTAVVTGAGSGIGESVSELLRASGETVVGWDLSGSDIECDISDPDSVDRALASTIDRHGVPSKVVACAGIGASGMLIDESFEKWNKVLAVNLTGTWLTLRAVASAMIDAGIEGSIVAVTSVSGTLSDRNMGAYCASKAGADMLVKVAAAEWGVHGIRVNGVGPGITRTPMLARPEALPGWVDGLTERTALGRLGEPVDVASAIVDVLDMTWVTGQIIHADGGIGLQSPIDSYGQMLRLTKQAKTSR